jgi:hypothetical protein
VGCCVGSSGTAKQTWHRWALLTPCDARVCPPSSCSGAFEEALQLQYAEGRAYEETISWAKAKQALRAPSNILLIMQAVPGCLPWGVIGAYLNDYFSQVGLVCDGLGLDCNGLGGSWTATTWTMLGCRGL